MIIMRNSDQNNEHANRADLYLRDAESLTDERGDRSGGAMWGWNEDKNLWLVKRKGTRRAEYFRYKSQFSSFIAVGLFEVLRSASTIPPTMLMPGTSKDFLKTRWGRNSLASKLLHLPLWKWKVCETERQTKSSRKSCGHQQTRRRVFLLPNL